MPVKPVDAVLEILRRDSRLRHSASDTIAYLMDLMFYGELHIFEQVSSSETADFVNLVGLGHGERVDEPLWLVSCVSTGADPVPGVWRSTGGDPFEPRLDPRTGLLHGLGACSGKVDLVLKILAASRFRHERLVRPLHVVALFGEEARGTGIRALLDGNSARPAAALVGAPTNLEIWTDHPGYVSFRLQIERQIRHRRMPPTRGFFEVEVPGRSAHAQVPHLGADALARGLEVLKQLRQAGDVRVLSFEAGEASNRVPARCAMQIATSYDDLPPLPPDVTARALADGTPLPFPIDPMFEAWLRARDAGLAAVAEVTAPERNALAARPRPAAHTGWLESDRDTVTGVITMWTGPGVDTHAIGDRFVAAVQRALAREDELDFTVQVTQDRAALAAGADDSGFLTAARESLRAAGVPPVLSGGRLSTDAGLIAETGAATLVFGPGRGAGDLYRDDEGIPVSHLEAALRFYEAMIARWCLARRPEEAADAPTSASDHRMAGVGR